MRARFAALILALLATAGPCLAQEVPRPPRSPILTIDQERLFRDSAYGQSLLEELEQERDQLTAENRRIDAELIAEEQDLTQQRQTLEPAAFREKAAAFDSKVSAIRQAQVQKLRVLTERREDAQKQFYAAALPVITELLRARGALVVVEQKSVILSAEQIDITDDTIAVIDARAAAARQSLNAAEPDDQ